MREEILARMVLEGLRVKNGYLAAPTPDYWFIWMRDVIYMSLSNLFSEPSSYVAAVQGVLDTFLRDEIAYRKLEWLIIDPPRCDAGYAWRFPHAKRNPDGSEITESWGHKQYDAYGAFLFAISLGIKAGLGVIRNEKDIQIINLLVRTLHVCRFWQDADFGMWEEGGDRYELHASSIGAVRAGIASVIPLLGSEEKEMAEETILLADRTLAGLLPRESAGKSVDLALLSLIFPYRLLGNSLADEIIRNVEEALLGKKGVRRYLGDPWYAVSNHEAEWPMGLYWLSVSHACRYRPDKAREYLAWGDAVCLADRSYLFPELYAGGWHPNEHTPLGWCAAMSLIARRAVAGLPF